MKKIIVVIGLIIAYTSILIIVNHNETNLTLPILSIQIKYDEEIEVYTPKKEWLNEYVDSLEMCFDESIMYDKENNWTILKHKTERINKFMYKYSLELMEDNYCNQQFSLDEGYLELLANNMRLNEIELEKCSYKTNKSGKITDEKCEGSIIKYNIYNLLSEVIKLPEIQVKERIPAPIKLQNKISLHYSMFSKTYVMEIYEYDKYIVFKEIDENDIDKYVKYARTNNIDQILNEIYNSTNS